MINKRINLLLIFILLSLMSYGQVNRESSIPEASPMGTIESYADGLIKGFWQFNHFNDDETPTYGHKTVNSVYDAQNNRIFILSDVKNVMVGDLTDSASLMITNQNVIVNGNLFEGVVRNNKRFRLLAAIQPEWDNGYIYYSDDEGKSWNKSNGGDLSDKQILWSTVLEDGTILSLLQKTVNKSNASISIYDIIISKDYGSNFTTLLSWQENDASKILACNPYNTDDVYLIRKIKNTHVWLNEKLNIPGTKLERVSSHYTKADPVSFVGTFLNDTTHLYIGASKNGYYSSDGGKTWNERKLKNRLAAIDPANEKLLIQHSANTWISKDGGNKWERLPWWEPVFGWDLQKMRWFKKKDNSWVGVLTNDFGAHFTSNFTDSISWKHLNTDNIHMILHHGAYNEDTDLLLTANQDRGTIIFEKNRDNYYSGSTVTKADGLRICIADNGNSYWYIHYWNTVYHKKYVKGEKVKLDSNVHSIRRVLRDTTWYTPPMQPSWKNGEDAIFMAGNNKIIKLSYDPYYESISRMELPFDLGKSSKEVISGLATCKADPERMYAASKNGKFWISDDQGKTWDTTEFSGTAPFVKNRPWWGPHGYIIETDPGNADIVYWAGEGDRTNSFLISYDAGQTFNAHTNGLPKFSNIRDLAITPGGDFVFASNGYVYVKQNDRWYDMRGGSAPNGGQIDALEYLPEQKIVRFFTFGVGVLDFVLEN